MKKTVLILILLLAAILRFNQLNSLPALNADEAAIGYNAYSLLLTGKDEHGNPWPIHFESFGDWKPGFYFYLVLPFIKLLGLTEAAVRIPSAVLGVLTVFLVWLLVRRLGFSSTWMPEISAFLLAVSPWHIHFSRGGWETNVSIFFTVLGVWLWLKAVFAKNVWYMILAFVFFDFSLYTYHAARIVVPLLVFSLFLLYHKHLVSGSSFLKIRKYFLAGVLVGLVIFLPLGKETLGPAGLARASGVGLLADEGPFWKTNEQRGEHKDQNSLFVKILHNRPINYTIAFLKNYLSHFDGIFLFLSGDEIQRNKVPEMGVLYLFQIPLLFIGFVQIAQRSKKWKLVISWLLIAPIPAALTFQSPNALRSENMVIPLTIISAYGMVGLLRWTRRYSAKLFRVVFVVLAVLMFWDISRYLHQYWVHMPKEYPFSSQYGFKELVSYLSKIEDNYSKIIVTDRYDQPYILFLFYKKYPPARFQTEHVLTSRDKFGFSTVRSFGQYRFVSVNWDTMRDMRNVVLVGTPQELNRIDANVVKRICFPNGEPAFLIVPL